MCTFLVPVFLGASITYPISLKGPDLLAAIKGRGVSILVGVPQLLALFRNSIMKKISGLPRPLPFILLKLHGLARFCREKFNINIGSAIFSSVHKGFGKQFRFFASGGAKLDPSVMKDLEALGFTVLEGYGLTETSPVLTFNPVSRRKPGSAGKPLPSVTIRITDPSDTGEGEIEIKGPMVMKGYYNNEAATAEVLRDGWFRTGDRGRLDKDGYLFITGRSKEVIVLSSGKNIYPEDVEKLYLDTPLI
jgi:long-chain acyl-CoA synthetase